MQNIAPNAEVNVHSDWNSSSGDNQILNKPTNVSTWTNDSGYLTAETDSLISVTNRGNTTTNSIGIGNLTAGIGTFTGALTIGGNLTVNGTQTIINSNTLQIGDSQVLLNKDETGTPSQNAGINVERGTSTNVLLRWNETSDKWEFTNDGSTFQNIPTTNTTYSVSAVDGGQATEKKIRLTGSDPNSTDDVTLAAGTNLSVARSGDTITFNNTATDSDTTYNQSCVDSSNDILLRLSAGGSGSGNDDIKVKAGNNITLTHDNASEFTISGVDAFPSGGIIMWSGAANAIPSGWVLCNGSNSTPDLRGRFVVGYSDTDNDYDVGDTGGVKNQSLSVSQMPSHSHSGTTGGQDTNHTHDAGNLGTNNTGSHNHTVNNWGGAFGSNSGAKTFRNDHTGTSNAIIQNAGAHSHNVTGTTTGQSSNHAHSFNTNNAGSGSSIENRPPYYALCYIMKS